MNFSTTDKPPARSTGWLVGLLLTTFVIGTGDFVVAGVLPAIASGLGVSEGAAGQLVTVFSVAFALGAPILAVATARLPKKVVLVGGVALFAVINLVTALAPSYPLIMMLRVLAALVAATVSPAAFGIAGSLAAPERMGRAIGTVAAGLTVSLVVGVPVGSWLSAAFGWRSTFVLVGVFAAVVAILAAITLPSLPKIPDVGVRDRIAVLRRPAVLLSILGTVIGACAGFMSYTYIAPITHDLTGADSSYVPLFILVVGVSGAVGTMLGGRLTDQWGADRSVLLMFGGVFLATVTLAIIGQFAAGAAPIWLVCLCLVLWGLAGWGNNPPMNSRMLHMAGNAGTEAVALNTSGLYVGIALAGAIGGGALNGGGGAGVLLAAAAAGVVTIVVMALAVRRYPSTPATDTDDAAETAEPSVSARTG